MAGAQALMENEGWTRSPCLFPNFYAEKDLWQTDKKLSNNYEGKGIS